MTKVLIKISCKDKCCAFEAELLKTCETWFEIQRRRPDGRRWVQRLYFDEFEIEIE